MIEEAMQWLRDNASGMIEKIGDKTFSTEAFTEIKPAADPYPPVFEVQTLTGLVGIVKEQMDDFNETEWLLHVRTHDSVEVVKKKGDYEYGRRQVIARAKAPTFEQFPFGAFIDPEKFHISVHSLFVQNDDSKYLLQMSANITSETVVTSEDDNISQKVGIRHSVAIQGVTQLRSRLKLIPFRTFSEADQPESEFILRAKSTGPNSVPNLALIEADGGRWKASCIDNVRRWLTSALPSMSIVS